MSVALRRQRDGKLRPYWYGEYKESDGKRKILNLGKWRGTPPPSLLGTGEETTGDVDFEASRQEAEAELKRHADEARRKGRVEHLTERLIESKTGRAVQYARIGELADSWRNLGRESAASPRYLAGCDAHFKRFVDFMRTQNSAAAHLYEVTPEDAAAFVASCRETLAPATAKYCVRLMNKAFSRFLPVGAANPFSAFVGRRGNGGSGVIHRKPFTAGELQALLDAARDDDFMYPLIVTAACTGMRRGDVCKLKWEDVDLASGMLAAKTSKTEAPVEIPLFEPLREVLEAQEDKREGHVFPKAAAMLRNNPNGLTWRFKKIVAAAFSEKKKEEVTDTRELVPAADIEDEATEAIRAKIPEGKRQARMVDVLHRYCAGASYRKIVKAAGYSKGTISTDLHTIEDMLDKRFLRQQATSVKHAIRKVSRVERKHGQRSASIRDWHALRATWVTLALAAGVPVELVRRVTGHATVEVVLKHYFQPDREQFRVAITSAMPDVLTGGAPKRLKPADELAALAAKVADGSATKKEKKRLRALAAKV